MRDYPSSWFNSNLLTSDKEKTARLKIDSQQTSFEENRQFKFFDEIVVGSSDGDQLVYKVASSNPVILFYRMLGLYNGGVTYRIYEDDGSHTFTGSLSQRGRITPVNTDLSDSGLSSHPYSTATILGATGIEIFTPGSGPITGTSAMTSNQANRTAGALAGEDVRLGYSAGLSAWIVMTKIDSVSGDTEGEFELYFEERF